MLYLSQFLSADVQKKGAQSGTRQLLPLSMSKKSRQKMKTSPKKNWFWPLKRGVGGGLTSTFWSKLKTNIPNGLLMARFPIKSGVKVDFGAPFDFFFFFPVWRPNGQSPPCFPTHRRHEGGPTPKKFTEAHYKSIPLVCYRSQPRLWTFVIFDLFFWKKIV